MSLAAVLNASGQAIFSTTSLSVASHAIIAAYGGDSRFAFLGSSSSALAQSVAKASSSTSLRASVNPSAFGQAVVFTATVVASAPGGGTPAGTVQFKQGTTVLGSAPLNALGQASFQTIALAVGNNTITAVYLGNTSFLGSTSTALTQTVVPDASLPVVKSSLNPALVSQTVTLTAIVRAGAPGSGTPTGTVTFFDSATSLGSGTLTAGQATFSTASLNVGGHLITAVYAGDTHFTGNTSPAFGQVVHLSGHAITAANDLGTQSGAGTSSLSPFGATVSSPAGGLVVAQVSKAELALEPSRVDSFFTVIHSATR